MDHELIDVEQLAGLLNRDVREISKLANRGHLPGHKVAGEWRFSPGDIQYWVERGLPGYTVAELTGLETGAGQGDKPIIATLLSEAAMAVPLMANTRFSVLKEMVTLAEQTWQLYDPVVALEAVREREEKGTTAMDGGVAFLHPSQPLGERVQGDSILAFGRTDRGIPFGAKDRGLTDLFFLVLAQDRMTHLSVLARLSRMFMQPGFADSLRAASSVHEARLLLESGEAKAIAA